MNLWSCEPIYIKKKKKMKLSFSVGSFLKT